MPRSRDPCREFESRRRRGPARSSPGVAAPSATWHPGPAIPRPPCRMSRPLMRRIPLALASLCASCATLVAPGPDMVPVNSTPPGANVIVNGAVVGTTPMLLPVKRGGGTWFLLRLEHEGLEPRDVGIKRTFNGWFVGNVLFGGLIGMCIDAITGNTLKVRSAEVVDEDLTRPSTRPAPPPLPPVQHRPAGDGYGDTIG